MYEVSKLTRFTRNDANGHRAKLSYFLNHNSIAIHLSDLCGIKKILDISKN